MGREPIPCSKLAGDESHQTAMPKAPTIRTELLEFLEEHGPDISTPIGELFVQWLAWRGVHHLSAATETERSFRQALSRLEQLGRLRVDRQRRKITGLRLLEPPPPGAAERIRRLERERAAFYGRFVEASEGAEKDLFGQRTPHLNGYVKQRRSIERARRDFLANGLDPNTIRAKVDPLGEEALALKERLLRVETELLAWRELGAKQHLSPEWRELQGETGRVPAETLQTRETASA